MSEDKDANDECINKEDVDNGHKDANDECINKEDVDNGHKEDEEKVDNDDRYKSRLEKIREEFKLSISEMKHISTYIKSMPKTTPVYEILENIVETNSLNVREKVALAHTLGIFRAEIGSTRKNSKIVTIEVNRFR